MSGRTAWFHCFAGVAGDMALAALLDAGAPLDDVRDLLDRLGLEGWSLRTEAAVRNGVGATRVMVEVAPDQPPRRFAELAGLVEGAGLPERVAGRSLAVLRALAEAEAAVHRQPVDEVHLHELGGHDTLVDVVGAVAALELLGVDRVTASPVAVGTGTVTGAHGVLPNPPPAVVSLLRGVPVAGVDTPVELTTPTGAALLATLADGFGPLPPMVVVAAGFGAGTAELPGLPNCLQVVLGEAVAEVPGGRPLELVETTVDDVTGEVLAHTLAALLEAGALDAWITPVVMKRGRPGHVVTALADPAVVAAVHQTLQRETGTLGVRTTPVRRWAAPRRVEQVDVQGHAVGVKVGPASVKAEHVDAARAARALGMPVRDVARVAEAAWRGRHPDVP